jgi:dCMP deaminase
MGFYMQSLRKILDLLVGYNDSIKDDHSKYKSPVLNKWDARFIEMAKLISTWSKDPTTKCGAVIVRDDKTIASVGFNGFPRGLSDDVELYNHRETKLARTVHAELNAIFSAHGTVKGHTIYIWPMPTCDRCAAHIVQSGITRVVCPEAPPAQAERWEKQLQEANKIFNETSNGNCNEVLFEVISWDELNKWGLFYNKSESQSEAEKIN